VRRLPLLIVLVAAFLALANVALAKPHPHRHHPRLSAGVEVSPAAFSPNGDGAQDGVTITVELDAPASITVIVLDAAGVEAARLADVVPADAGSTELAWNGGGGPNGGGALLPDGTYTLQVTATDVAGDESEASTPIVIDTVAPSFNWRTISPEPLRSHRPVRFTYRATDRSPTLTLTYRVLDADGSPLANAAPLDRTSGKGTFTWDAEYPAGSPIDPGLYEIDVAAMDDAGNAVASDLERFRSLRPVHSGVWRRVDGAGRHVALTFDDCNDSGAWGRILSILDDHHVKASFFCVGANVSRYPSLARRTVALGETVGSHTWTHPDLTTLSFAQVRAQVVYDERVWWTSAGWTPAPYFRPPFGAYDATVVSAAGSAGYLRTILWDVDPQDWRRPGASVIRERVLSAVRPGSIVVMHTLDQTADAVPGILAGLRSKNLRPVSLGDLFKAAGYH